MQFYCQNADIIDLMILLTVAEHEKVLYPLWYVGWLRLTPAEGEGL